jgi:enolase
MSKISKVISRQVFDSRGNPTIEAEVFSKILALALSVLQAHLQEHMKLMKKEILIIQNI